MMENFPELKAIVDSFEDSTELQEFVEFAGIVDEPYVKEKLLALKWQELEIEMDLPLLEPSQDDVKRPKLDQYGGQQPGPSYPYHLEKVGEKTFKSKAAVDTKYQVHLDKDYWNDKKLKDIHGDLHDMFQNVLEEAKQGAAENDAGRVLIHHPSLDNAIVVPLHPIEELNADLVMEHIEKVLTSHEELAITEGFDIDVGIINVPKGGGRVKLTNVRGEQNSIKRKRSIAQIVNEDNMCMARAIAVCWARVNKITNEEWQELTRHEPQARMTQQILRHKKVPDAYYRNICNKNRREQRELATTISNMADVPTDRPACLNDIEAFEHVLDVNILVVSARLGNKFIKVTSHTNRTNLYLYLVEEENNNHFHGITNICGFFSQTYFCETCLKPYQARERHYCSTTCIVCKTKDCMETETQMSCIKCHMTCRSMACFQRHVDKPKYTRGPKKGHMSVYYQGQWHDDLQIVLKEFVKSPIALVPADRYGLKQQYSKVSIQWLEWMSHVTGTKIRHALNGGEKKLYGTRYKLDGYCTETNTAYEFHGFVYHGCRTCFPTDRDQMKHPRTNQSMEELYALTMKKKNYIEKLGMKYVCIWEHEFKHSSKECKQFINSLDIVDRLSPRDSFFGGRTNACQLHYIVKGGEKIKYVDFTSLYPWVNKYCRYPLGHPDIITSDFQDVKYYFGIAKVKVLAPRKLYLPVLPYRSNGKLKFPLCRTCADHENQDPCHCSEEDRSMIGTWCTPELQMAVDQGYKIIKMYEVYHWEDTTQYDPSTGEGGLFATYINTFLKIKQESSDWPDWIQTEQDKKMYVKRYFEKEGVRLDWCKIVKNPGLRALAKLCLNSFWGKFGQRLNMCQSHFVHDSEVEKFFQILSDPTKDIQNFHIAADDMIQLEWIYKASFVPEDYKTNIFLATFTTTHARIKLLTLMNEINGLNDRRILYHDTDSVIYVSRPGEHDPSLGDYLGELTNELDGDDYIVEFVSGGPKNYSYRTKSGKETCKVRGFTLNFTNSKLINFDVMKDIITTPDKVNSVTLVNPSKICREKRKRKLFNREEKKKYQKVYTKRVILPDLDTLPYGY